MSMRQNRRFPMERPVLSRTITANPRDLTRHFSNKQQNSRNNQLLKQQLRPDFVQIEKERKRNTSKFVPMQYRTQPLNMPGSGAKPNTTLSSYPKGILLIKVVLSLSHFLSHLLKSPFIFGCIYSIDLPLPEMHAQESALSRIHYSLIIIILVLSWKAKFSINLIWSFHNVFSYIFL